MIIFDLDGTLADCEHRRHFVSAPERYVYSIRNTDAAQELVKTETEEYKAFRPNWKAFYEACDKDKPIEPTIQLLRYYHIFDENIEIWSGRCESVRQKTEEWLEKCVFEDLDFSQYRIHLKMRPHGDSTPDDVLKEKWLDEALADGKKIAYVFDDRPKVVRLWRRRGIFVFDCNQKEGEF